MRLADATQIDLDLMVPGPSPLRSFPMVQRSVLSVCSVANLQDYYVQLLERTWTVKKWNGPLQV